MVGTNPHSIRAERTGHDGVRGRQILNGEACSLETIENSIEIQA